MSREQRWAASGVVVLLGALWGAVGLAVTWLVTGLAAVRRVASGEWSWRAVAWCGGAGTVLSASSVLPSRSLEVLWFSLLLGFQALALAAWTALLWTPAPVAGAGEDGA